MTATAPVTNTLPAANTAVPSSAFPQGNAPNALGAGGAGAGSTPFASASLYVGDLNSDVTEALLFEIFNAVGPVASVRVCRDATTKRSLGYAYVNFHRVDDAERALDTMNFKNIRNRPCRIMWSHRDPSLRRSGVGNIFVNHLAKSIDNKQLYDTFSMFGNILSCKVSVNAQRESLGYGFVHYETDEAAQTAIARVDGKVIAGEKVSVSIFKSKKDRGGANKFRYTNVFVKNLPAEITKETLESLFSKHGQITSCVIATDKENKQRAFGFVNYSTPEEATAAVENLNNYEFEGKKLYVSRAQKKEEREKELRERFEAVKAERQKKYAGINLYVKNLSDECDDARLTAEFSKYGSITSCKIMRDQNGKSRGFGFVCFSSADEATKAVTEMNGRMFDGKPLYVSLAQRKDVRRQQLEAQYAARMKLGGGPMGGPMGAMGAGGIGGGVGGPQPLGGAYGGMGNVPPMMFGAGNAALAQQQRLMAQAGYPMAPNVMGNVNAAQMGRWPGQNPQMNAMNAAAMRGPMMGAVGMPGMYNGMIQQQNQRAPMPMNAPPGVNMGPNGNMPGINPQGIINSAAMGIGGGRGQQQQQQPQRPGAPTANNGQRGGVGPAANTSQPNRNGNGPASAAQRPMVGPNGMPLIGNNQSPQPPLTGPNQSIRYSDNVRNRSQQAPLGNASMLPPQNEVVVIPAPNEQLTIKALAAAPEEMRKQMIGERLFPQIKLQEPNLAGKITGMLLEMDNGELIHLLESHAALQEKIHEALQVLQQHPAADGEQNEQDDQQ
jgi:polyadenylate-binding protein